MATDISASRSFIMGVATLMVVLFHQHFVSRSFFLPCSAFGYWGVDFFLFLSGFGLSYSLQRKPAIGKAVWGFYGRRLSRVMPAVLLMGWVQLFLSPSAFLLYAFGLNLWYIRALLMMYAVAPFLFTCFSSDSRVKWWTFWALLSYGLCMAIIYFEISITNGKVILWPVERLPVFMLGILFFHVAQRGAVLNKRLVWLMLSLLMPVTMGIVLCFRLSDRGTLPAVMGATALLLLCIQIPFFCHWLHRFKSFLPSVPLKAVEWCGIYSLEIYAVHEFIFGMLLRYDSRGGWCMLAAALVISFVSAYLLKYCATGFCRAIGYLFHKLA